MRQISLFNFIAISGDLIFGKCHTQLLIELHQIKNQNVMRQYFFFATTIIFIDKNIKSLKK